MITITLHWLVWVGLFAFIVIRLFSAYQDGKKLLILMRLKLKIEAVVSAYELDYDGEEGERWKKTSLAGVSLDDFILENGKEIIEALEWKIKV